MGFFDWMGEQFSRAATAAENTANWVGAGITHPIDALRDTTAQLEARSHGFNSVDAYREWQAKQPGSNTYYGTGNADVDTVLNAIGGVGVGYSTNGGVHAGMSAPVNVLAQRDIEGQADAAIAAQGDKMPSWSIPPNPSSTNVGASSYDFRTEPTNQIGMQRIDLVHPESTVRPTSVGVTPIDVGQPGTDSYAAGMQAAKPSTTDSQGRPLHGPGSADWNSNGPDNTQAGGSTYKPPAESGVTLGQGLIAGAGLVSAGVNLVNGHNISEAEKEAAKTQAQGYTDALKQNQAQFDTIREDTKPWREAGSRALTNLESFDTDHPRGDFTASPDYHFRLSEGLKALRNAAGAQGSLVSGETMKAMNNYAGQSASQEYGNWYNRQETTRNTDRAALQSLAGLGQTAVGQSNAAGQAFAGNAMAGATGMANALAAGTTGAANATASGYQSGAQSLMGSINSAIQLGQNQEQYNALLKLLDKAKTATA
jgi:hypothetical protein